MSDKDDITRKLRKMMAMGATPEHGLIVVRWHYISTMEEWRMDVDLCADAADEIERLRAERDDARREVLTNKANHLPTMSDPNTEAKRRGWDCFKEKK
jgi:hypothetical protein